ncbi:Asx homology domain-containing protein [Phanerochaete sordida]|uniref:Asx homology domain-containing protein n=1 Tax=Phanerochaete sordida TaxID=48140 RepID=A0A9P3GDE8_9APHY|nr:Asx homology domain-containing protein [Phanerochaete sordida]
MSDAGPSTRPRRSTRAPARAPAPVAPSPAKKQKQQRDPAARLAYLLEDSRSKLATVDIADVVSYEHFAALSAESQALLCALLPPTAFASFAPHVDGTHPSGTPTPPADGARTPATLDPAFLADTHVRGAARAWQEHIAAGFFSAASRGAQERYRAGVRSGEMHAEWKDDAWARAHPPPRRPALYEEDPDLNALVKAGDIREGDVLAYARRFPALGLTIAKDMLVHKADATTGALSVLLQPGSASALPRALLVLAPAPPAPPTLTVDGALASADLEDALLDADGRVPTARRGAPARPGARAVPRSASAAKALVVYRWREETMQDLEIQMALERGGRERVGSVWYLRRT